MATTTGIDGPLYSPGCFYFEEFFMLQSLSRDGAIVVLRCCMNVLGHVAITEMLQ
jgi:hypothetical protein